MDRVRTLFLKEARSALNSPTTYIVSVVFLLITGWLFATPLFLVREARLDSFLDTLPLLMVFLVPALTMRLMAEEFKQGTVEILMTYPVKDYEIILAKYLTGVLLVALTIGPTLWYAVLVGMLGPLDWGQAAGSYLGVFLLGAAFAAIGLFASCLTRSQVTAFILGFAACFLLWILGKVTHLIAGGVAADLIGFIGLDSHVENIGKGVVDSRDILYFASLAAASLFAATGVLNSRRWR